VARGRRLFRPATCQQGFSIGHRGLTGASWFSIESSGISYVVARLGYFREDTEPSQDLPTNRTRTVTTVYNSFLTKQGRNATSTSSTACQSCTRIPPFSMLCAASQSFPVVSQAISLLGGDSPGDLQVDLAFLDSRKGRPHVPRSVLLQPFQADLTVPYGCRRHHGVVVLRTLRNVQQEGYGKVTAPFKLRCCSRSDSRLCKSKTLLI
jgi:hypothetical protein